MARCEDFPCCGHYDEATGPGGGSWCPDENGIFPPINLPTCMYCGMYIDPEEGHDCDYQYEPDYDDEEEQEDELQLLRKAGLSNGRP